MTAPVPRCWDRLDSDALQVAQLIAGSMPVPVRELGAARARELLATPPSDRPLTPLRRVEELVVPTRAGGLRVRRYHAREPAGAIPRPALLYLHGGGFVLGTLDGVDEACRALATRSGWDVLSLEYRLAPEHPYPAALEDALDALAWLRRSAGDLGIDAGRIAVGGDSAGGNLAAAICLHRRNHGRPLPVAQVLVYPAVDDQFSTPSWREFADAPLLTAADARWLWEQYVGTGHQPGSDEYAAPLNARSLRGLPPALILTAEVDPVRDDAEAYADRLRHDGVPVTSVRHLGVFHGFFTEIGTFAKTEAAITDVVRYLRAIGR
ncbi:alpha/beta hydrolase [Pseudonocardia sp. C8]|uniref:alpha/beta hydrolase n=1 Tax=Pseudonocardia sp. C8 TaxID=2762759 RepID=UPI001642C7C6|nr:alpha/beta hydrolase [Pseudonocardia sp. C8]MBC3189945.1 alpha/beta hydrolase [Pseudonocardia sp. C8]